MSRLYRAGLIGLLFVFFGQLQAMEEREITEGILDAPVAEVWKAFTTKQGQEAWNVAHAEIDLRVGGKMLTHYSPQGKIGDPGTIENTFLCYDPGKMIAFRVTNPPANFPFKNAIKNVWSVLYFEEAGPSKTKLTLAMIGYGSDEESQKMRQFFKRGNALTMEKFKKHFTKE